MKIISWNVNSIRARLDNFIAVAKEFNVPTLDASGTPEEVFEKLKKLFQI